MSEHRIPDELELERDALLFDELALAARAGLPAGLTDPAAMLLTAFVAELGSPPALDLEAVLAPPPDLLATPALAPLRRASSWRRRAGAVLAACALTLPLGSAAFAAAPGTPLYPVRVAVFGLAPSDHEGRAQEALTRAEEILHQREQRSLDAAGTELDQARRQLGSMSEGDARAEHEARLERLEALRDRLRAPRQIAPPPAAQTPSSPAAPTPVEKPTKAEKPTKPAKPAKPAEATKSPKAPGAQQPARTTKAPKAQKPAQKQKSSETQKPSKAQKPAAARSSKNDAAKDRSGR